MQLLKRELKMSEKLTESITFKCTDSEKLKLEAIFRTRKLKLGDRDIPIEREYQIKDVAAGRKPLHKVARS